MALAGQELDMRLGWLQTHNHPVLVSEMLELKAFVPKMTGT